MIWITSSLLTALVVFIGFGLIYTGICGLSGRAIYLPRRGGAMGDTVGGVGARVLGAFCLLLGVFWCVMFARAAFG